MAEGRFVVQRLIAAGSFGLHSALVSPTALAALEVPLRGVDAPVYVAPQPLLNEIAGFSFHRGCLALAVRPSARSVDAPSGSHLLLGLESIGNPDNVGGLFRTAATLGVDAVLLGAPSGDPFYRKAIRTSMGAVLQMPFVTVGDWPEAVATLRGTGFSVIALTPQDSAMPLDEYAVRRRADERLLVLVGAKGSGLSAALLAAADVRVRIPIASAVDSVDVVVAAGIALSRLGGNRRSGDQEISRSKDQKISRSRLPRRFREMTILRY